jgi:hypothetical protein
VVGSACDARGAASCLAGHYRVDGHPDRSDVPRIPVTLRRPPKSPLLATSRRSVLGPGAVPASIAEAHHQPPLAIRARVSR